jgi:ComF family protein
VYEGPVARAIRALKFSGWRALAPSLAAAMVEALRLHPVEGFEPDAVTWVPLASRRRGARGFDQAEILARLVASKLDLNGVPLLTRLRETPAQATRTGRQRRVSLRGAFTPKRGRIPPSILLVDDVMTTGVTAAACAEALRKGGATRVAVLTAARSCRGSIPARCYGTA